MRFNQRAANQLRQITIEYDIQPHADASVFIKMGGTHVLCGVTIEEGVPSFLKDKGQGWITAEYGILPCATHSRVRRESVSGRSGRTYEIQRLIGRSLRMMLNLQELGENTLRVDCDVLNADGSTRCASITGSSLAIYKAVRKMVADGRLAELPDILPVAAVSVGIVDNEVLLDLDYTEDSRAGVDGNFILAGDGKWIEVQLTAEGSPFSTELFSEMTQLAKQGTSELFQLWPNPLL